MKILCVIGTRPEAIKMLPLLKELKKHHDLDVRLSFSGQHETLADDVFRFFNILPDYRFSGLNKSRTLNEMTIALLNYFDMLFNSISPDIILVHGDTTTALCSSLSAFYLGIKVAHVEAGLRTYDPLSPFPEEFNRVAIDSLSSIHFAPTEIARQNLIKEGKSLVFVTGNTCIDALKYTLSNTYSHPFLTEANNKKLLLITAHRRENLGERISSALLGIRDAIENENDVLAILPAHPNPSIRNTVFKVFNNIKNIKICPPLPLYDFHNLLSRSYLVISDSGGVQEEAAYLGIPLFLLRNSTERCEAVKSGNVRVIGTNRANVTKEIKNALLNPHSIEKMRQNSIDFGDGNASQKIAKKLLSLL